MTSRSKAQGVITVRAHFRRAGETVKEACGDKVIEVASFEAPHGHANVTLGKKIYRGQYNSDEIRVSVSIPTYTEEMPDALDRATALAHAHVVKLLKRFGQ